MALSEISMQQAALQTEPQTLVTALTAALQSQVSAPQFAHQEILDLLNTLASISITCKTKLQQIPTIDLQNPEIIKQLCNDLVQPATIKKIQDELTFALQTAQQQVAQDRAEYAQQLRTAMQQTPSVHRQTALDEAKFVVDKTITANRDKAYYDISVLGLLFASLIEQRYMVAVDEKYFTRGFKFVAPTGDEYLQHMRDMHGDQEIINAPPTLKFK